MELLLVIVFWLVIGILSAFIAESKGRSGCGGFLLGALLGPIGLAIILLTGRQTEELEKRELYSGMSRRCPDCAEIVKVDARKCKHCGTEFSQRYLDDLQEERAALSQIEQKRLLIVVLGGAGLIAALWLFSL